MPLRALGSVHQAAAVDTPGALAVRPTDEPCDRVLNGERPVPAGGTGWRHFGGYFPSTTGSSRR